MQRLYELEQWVNKLKSNEFFKNLAIDSFLDRRDSAEYDSLWMHDYHIIIQYQYSAQETEFINELRKKTYRQIYLLTLNADMATYIRDDVEIIAQSILRKQQNLWVIWHLWSSYLNDLDPTIT